jgi:hypothetical protein
MFEAFQFIESVQLGVGRKRPSIPVFECGGECWIVGSASGDRKDVTNGGVFEIYLSEVGKGVSSRRGKKKLNPEVPMILVSEVTGEMN